MWSSFNKKYFCFAVFNNRSVKQVNTNYQRKLMNAKEPHLEIGDTSKYSWGKIPLNVELALLKSCEFESTRDGFKIPMNGKSTKTCSTQAKQVIWLQIR